MNEVVKENAIPLHGGVAPYRVPENIPQPIGFVKRDTPEKPTQCR